MKKDTPKRSSPEPFPIPLHRPVVDCRKGNDRIARLNHVIDAHQVPHGVNESLIEGLLHQWERLDRADLPHYWLLAARLFEMAILCAGHYVDHCEITSAGDLLFNPRKILIYQKGVSAPCVKRRHGRLSTQLRNHVPIQQSFPDWFKFNAFTQTVAPAIVPYLLSCLEHSRCVAQPYLQAAHARVQKAAEAIGFIGAWSMPGTEALHDRMQKASPATRRLIADHLCAFDTTFFDALGKEIHRLCAGREYRSEYICGPIMLHGTAPRANDA